MPTIIMIAVFAAVFYFLMIRPENKRKKEAQEMRNALKVGDTVISIGGITGEVEKINENTIVIYSGNGTIELQKWAIRTVEPDTDSYTYDEDELEEEEKAEEAKEEK